MQRPVVAVPGVPLLLVPARPDQLDGVSSAREVQFRGHTLTAVRSTLANVRQLRQLGFAAPAPILHTYRFLDGTYRSQRQTAAFLTMNPRAFVLSEMGTGKTRATAYALDWLIAQGVVRRALVVAPLSTIGPVWFAELRGFFGHLRTQVMLGSNRARKYDGDWQVGLLNHHGVPVLLPKLTEDKLLDCIIIDEVAVFRNSRTKLWQALRWLTDRVTWVWGLTGSPTPNGPCDAWAQTRLVAPQQTERLSLGRWRARVEVRNGFQTTVLPDAAEHVRKLMQPAIRFTRASVVELPPLTISYRKVSMTREQTTAYNVLRRHLLYMYDHGQVTAANAGVLIAKLLQVAAGVVYDDAGKELALPSSPRLAVISEVVEQAAHKVLVFAGYRSVLRTLRDRLGESWQTELIDGSVPPNRRSEILRRFQDPDDPLRVLTAHPGTMAHGLTLTAADTMVWYSPILSRERFEQAAARITRPGQKHHQLQVRILGSPIDEKVYGLLEDRLQFQAQCLSLFETLRHEAVEDQ